MTKFKKLALTVLFAVFCLGLFVPSVLADTDKSVLISQKTAIDTVILNEAQYRDNSYLAFTDDLTALGGTAAIQAMIDDALALQVDVDAMSASLSDLLAALVTKEVYNQVNSDYFAAVLLDTTPNTLRSITFYEDELAQINAILELIIDDPRTGDATLIDLDDDVLAAADLLVLLGDKTELIAKWANGTSIDLGTGLAYTPSTFLLFQTEFDSFSTEDAPGIAYTVSEIVAFTDASDHEVSIAVSELDNALSMLILRADKTLLEADYQAALSVDSAEYTPSTFTQFTDGLALILAVILDPEVSQADVDLTLVDLADLYDLLVLRADKTLLQAEYTTALDIDESLYTPITYTQFTNGLADILAVIDDWEASQAVVDATVLELADLYEGLILRSDKTELSHLNDQVIIAYYEEKTMYTDSSYQAFRSAVLAYGHYLYVNEVVSDLNVTQASVDALEEELRMALGQLEERADVVALVQQYNIKLDVDLSPYTPASALLFTQGLEASLLVIESTDTNQALADATALALSQLDLVLVLRANLTTIEQRLAEAALLDEEAFTPASWQTLQQYVQLAETSIADPNVTQSAIDAMGLNLSDILELMLKTHKPIVIRANDVPYDIDAFIFVFETTIVGYFSDNPEVLTINDSGEIVGHEYGNAQVTIHLANGTTDTLEVIVKANLAPLTIVLAAITPIAATGLAFSLLWLPGKKFTFLKKMFRIRKK